jgi:hypothetical protein
MYKHLIFGSLMSLFCLFDVGMVIVNITCAHLDVL